MWVGDAIYFLSDRNGPATLFRYDTASGKVSQLVPNDGFELKSAAAGPGAIVYEQFGSIHLYDLAAGTARPVAIRVASDLPQVRPGFRKGIPDQAVPRGISPTGARVLFEIHGQIYTAPAEKGDIRNITDQPGVANRYPAWSPDGRWIAYFSDESGEYALTIRDQRGIAPPRSIPLGSPPTFYYEPTWSPDSRKIAFSDKRLNLWYIDVSHPVPVRVDANWYDRPISRFTWSPDGLAFAFPAERPAGVVNPRLAEVEAIVENGAGNHAIAHI